MSLVADGPEMKVCGRAGSSRAMASGRSAATWSARTTTRWKSGTRVSAAAALAGAVVEDDRPGLGDGGRAAGDHSGHRVQLAGGQRRVVADDPVPR